MKHLVDNSSLKKQNNFYSDIKDQNAFELKIVTLYFSEFEDKISDILIVKESEFMLNFFKWMSLIIVDLYNEEILMNLKMQEMMKKSEKLVYEKLYLSNYNILSKGLKESTNFSPSISLLTSFHPHCRNNEDYAIHKCNGKLIQISSNYINGVGLKKTSLEDKKNFNNVTHVICIGCKKSYLSNSIILFCKICNTDYYSYFLPLNENFEYQPSTWEKYHCGALINDKMKCIKCKDIFYLKIKENLLVCLNCKFQADPRSIIWTCFICNTDFQTGAKIYNPMEFKLIKNAIREALLYREEARPNIIPCCNLIIQQTIFTHKKECNGVLYKGEMNGKVIVVCEKCKMMNYENKHIWSCPKCFSRFEDENENIENDQVILHTEANQPSRNKIRGTIELSTFDFLNKNDLNGKSSIRHSTSVNLINDLINLKSSPKKDIRKITCNNFEGKYLPLATESNDEIRKFPKAKIKNDQKIDFNKIRFSSIANIEANKRIEKSQNLNYCKRILSSDAKFEVNKKVYNINKDLKNNKKLVECKGQKENVYEISIKNVNVITNFIVTPSNLAKVEINKENSVEKKEEVSFLNVKQNKLTGKKEDISSDKSNNLNKDDLYELENEGNSLKSFTFENFKVQHLIGEGSFGQIYHAVDKNNTKFAMKKMIVNDENQIKMFIDEFNLVYSCKHPNILKIYGYFHKKLDETTYALYVLMELATVDWDKEIKNRILNQNNYSEKELVQIMFQIVRALAFLQQNKYAHRDIKPQNVLVFGNKVYKIADFGEAKKVQISKLTNTLRGTELYMSPILFQALQMQKNDIIHNPYKSDVFSLAFCLIYAATFTYNPLYDLRKSNDIKTVNYVINRYFLNKFSVKFINMLRRMLEVNESKRFDFIELEKFLKENF